MTIEQIIRDEVKELLVNNNFIFKMNHDYMDIEIPHSILMIGSERIPTKIIRIGVGTETLTVVVMAIRRGYNRYDKCLAVKTIMLESPTCFEQLIETVIEFANLEYRNII